VPRERSNKAALSKTLADLVVPDRAEALVTLARTLAGAVDQSPANAALAKEYRATLVSLLEACTADDSNDEGAELVQLVRTPVGNRKDAG